MPGLENRSSVEVRQTGTSLKAEATGHVMHVVVQGPGSFAGRSTFLYDVRLRSYGASKLPNFRILAYFPHTKPAYSLWVTSPNDYTIFGRPLGQAYAIGNPSVRL